MVSSPAPEGSGGLEAAYRYCERIAREHYENFPVASILLPAPMRPHIAAIYAFARRADDFADEPGPDPDERLRLLTDWDKRLDRGVASLYAEAAASGDDLIFVALEKTIREFAIPIEPFLRLLTAFRSIVTRE